MQCSTLSLCCSSHSPSPSAPRHRAHPFMLTPSCSHAHPLMLTLSCSHSHAHPLMLTLSCFHAHPSDAHSLMLSCSPSVFMLTLSYLTLPCSPPYALPLIPMPLGVAHPFTPLVLLTPSCPWCCPPQKSTSTSALPLLPKHSPLTRNTVVPEVSAPTILSRPVSSSSVTLTLPRPPHHGSTTHFSPKLVQFVAPRQ
jgi:hypothetical protein